MTMTASSADPTDFSSLFDGFMNRGGAVEGTRDFPVIPVPGLQETVAERFAAFDEQHPEVWDYFCRFTFELVRAGHLHNSADAVLHRVRWETAVGGGFAGGEAFKINNNYSAYYARKFHETYPEYQGFFRTRKSRADQAHEAASDEPDAPTP